MKVLLVSSAGGHFAELEKIKLATSYETIVVTEEVYGKNLSDVDYFLIPGSRRNILKYFFVFLRNFYKAILILKTEKPGVIISTGSHSCVPFFYIGKILGIKNVYIESYAKVKTSSLTYKLIKNSVDLVVVQHEELLDLYKNSKYFGGIY